MSWQLDWEPAEHHKRVQQVREAIADGDVYQVNLTTRLRNEHTDPDPQELYAALIRAQRGAYNACLDLGRYAIVSASPELFFRWDNGGLTVAPMKGTTRRGDTNAEDVQIRAELVASIKQRAENVMIVDLLRNDLSRVAETGSVHVQSLLDAERYDTVWQLTSTVTAQPAPQTTLSQVFTALFPCGSVTGAPKVAATRTISRLETAPRGPYCGAIGMLAPPGQAFRARFSVAIRTTVLDRTAGSAVYGTGGGITWDSDPDEEYDEILAKTAILGEPADDFQLLETLRFQPGTGLHHLDRHLRRMLDSARYFGFSGDPDHIRTRINAATASLSLEPNQQDLPQRVRLLLARNGDLHIEATALPASDGPVSLVLDTMATATGRWTKHKTTRRDHYEHAAARHPHADDVILVDASGCVTETTRANLTAKIDGRWYTPPLTSGCLPGVEREHLLDAGRLRERAIAAEEITVCAELAVLSSLRGWRAAQLISVK